jgi:hypothetical protein
MSGAWRVDGQAADVAGLGGSPNGAAHPGGGMGGWLAGAQGGVAVARIKVNTTDRVV